MYILVHFRGIYIRVLTVYILDQYPFNLLLLEWLAV